MKLKYRPEIDGLRAIAVSAVIFYHAQITVFGNQPFKGGFIGVDIFFVISGYLIISIILKELITTGTFSFKYFYERRIRRILPALLVVMIVSLPFAWMYLLPDSFVDFSKSILYSLGFSSNFYFHYSGQEYGSESGLLKPFLHTWSLSVEEQYYILFPIILLTMFRYFKNHLLKTLVIFFIISLLMAHWGSKNYVSASFYLIHTRIWELVLGSILAYFETQSGRRSKKSTINKILPLCGLILICHSVLSFNDEIFHPSFYTLSPIIGVCLIIWFSHEDEFITKLLSLKLFSGIGLISYSLYLWHYPIFAFARIKDSTPSEYDKFEWIALTLTFSIISYFLIEKPFRNKKFSFKKIIYFLSLVVIFLFIFNSLTLYTKGFKSRAPIIPLELLKKNFDGRLKYNDTFNKCHFKFDIEKSEFCSFGNFEDGKDVFLVGDSHAVTLLFDLIEKSNSKKFNLISMTKPSGIIRFENLFFLSYHNFFGTFQPTSGI